jgi:large subunit ribosomal protein L23
MNQERLLKIIMAPHISEKSNMGSEKRNEFAFKVFSTSTKSEVKQAVELLFNTKVKAVRLLNVRSKLKMFRGKEGKRKAWKKAYVTLLPDQKLELNGAQ